MPDSNHTSSRLMPQPKPLVVSIGWVVECVEKRSHVEETRFLVNLDDFDITGGSLVGRMNLPFFFIVRN